ncbi:LysR family transcriptional regulator [Paenibacillus sp. GCM10028914]|uniref:LysR family transcriptional regulator n=1 Tax=Paenibacillus sp. GCM10028914 TaxID=3273416 RepID=UPI00360B3B69
MNIEQLKYVRHVAMSGSFTQAAQSCHITVTGISRAVSQLEAELGIKIFIRSRSGAEPTTEGKMIISKANLILNQLDELITEANSYKEMNEAKLRISTIPGPTSLLIEVLTGLRKEFPNIHLQISEQGTTTVLNDVREGRSDVGFVLFSEENIQTHKGLHFEQLVNGQLVLGVSRHSPLAALKHVTIHDLTSCQFVVYNDPYIIDYVNHLGDSVEVLFTSNNIESILKAVNENIAVTIGTEYSFRANPLVDQGDVVAIPLEMSLHEIPYLWSVSSLNSHTSKVAQIFVKRTINLMRRNQ